jgi:hypothetical protein
MAADDIWAWDELTPCSYDGYPNACWPRIRRNEKFSSPIPDNRRPLRRDHSFWGSASKMSEKCPSEKICGTQILRNSLIINGAPGRDRTCDRPIRNRLLYPLSYECLLATMRIIVAPAHSARTHSLGMQAEHLQHDAEHVAQFGVVGTRGMQNCPVAALADGGEALGRMHEHGEAGVFEQGEVGSTV